MSLEKLLTVGERRYTPAELAKPSKRDASKHAEVLTARQAQRRAQVRKAVYLEDRGRCRRCNKKLVLEVKQARHALEVAHVHEWVPRSVGGDPRDPLNCITLCPPCHADVQEHRVDIVACDETKLMRGPVEFPERKAA